MAIKLDHQLREQLPQNNTEFPITFFHDELATLPNHAGPLHWHPEFEIATATLYALDFQVGQEHILLDVGDSIFVNRNILHGIKQLHGDMHEPMPNIAFSSGVIASEISAVNQKYIQPIAACDSLPYIVFKGENEKQRKIHHLIKEMYQEMHQKGECYEMIIQHNLIHIFEYIFRNIEAFSKSRTSRIQIIAQVRIQKMLSYIYEHYTETVTLEDIARAANISRSEAGRCFNIYMGYSPIEALIQYRLQIAHKLLNETNLTLQEISVECGFNSVNYFSRQFRKTYGCSPRNYRALGK